MVTIEQKLSLFSKLLQQDIKNEIGGKLALIEEEYKQKQKEHNEAVDHEARMIVEKSIKRANIKKTEMVSKAKMQAKKDAMVSKEKCVNLCMAQLKEKVNEFVNSEAYEDYLLSCSTSLEGLGNFKETTIIYMTEEDITRYQKVMRETLTQKGAVQSQLKIEVCKAPIIGGIIVEVPEENIRIDLSIATLIEDHKALIIERVFEAIGQVGEIRE